MSDLSDEEMYEVEKILDKRINGDTIEYFIKWKNYSKNESTWEPLMNLKNVEKMIYEFNKNMTYPYKIRN